MAPGTPIMKSSLADMTIILVHFSLRREDNLSIKDKVTVSKKRGTPCIIASGSFFLRGVCPLPHDTAGYSPLL